MLLVDLARRVPGRRWAVTVAATALIFAGAYMLWSSAHPAFGEVEGTVAEYAQSGGQYSVTLEQHPLDRYTLAGDQAGAPAHIAPGSRVRMTVVLGTRDAVELHSLGGSQPPQSWSSDYRFAPADYAADHTLPGLLVMALGLALAGVAAYLALARRHPGAAASEARWLARADFGPQGVKVAALLQHLADLADDDWRLLGESYLRQEFMAPAAEGSRRALREASQRARREAQVGRARRAAESMARRHPPVRDTRGLDLRGTIVEPLGLAAAALALHDVLDSRDFDRLYGNVGRFIPLQALETVPDPTRIVSLPEVPSAT